MVGIWWPNGVTGSCSCYYRTCRECAAWGHRTDGRPIVYYEPAGEEWRFDSSVRFWPLCPSCRADTGRRASGMERPAWPNDSVRQRPKRLTARPYPSSTAYEPQMAGIISNLSPGAAIPTWAGGSGAAPASTAVPTITIDPSLLAEENIPSGGSKRGGRIGFDDGGDVAADSIIPTSSGNDASTLWPLDDQVQSNAFALPNMGLGTPAASTDFKPPSGPKFAPSFGLGDPASALVSGAKSLAHETVTPDEPMGSARLLTNRRLRRKPEPVLHRYHRQRRLAVKAPRLRIMAG